jgi:hypothetical protein
MGDGLMTTAQENHTARLAAEIQAAIDGGVSEQ